MVVAVAVVAVVDVCLFVVIVENYVVKAAAALDNFLRLVTFVCSFRGASVKSNWPLAHS